MARLRIIKNTCLFKVASIKLITQLINRSMSNVKVYENQLKSEEVVLKCCEMFENVEIAEDAALKYVFCA